jgi:hypothetical protein
MGSIILASSDSWLEIAKMVGALTAFVVGLLHYRLGQKWKRAQFVADEVRRFRDNPKVAMAVAMLDYNEKRLPLFPDTQGDGRFQLVNDGAVAAALEDADRADAQLARVEDAIRDCFDEFFDGLERFECFIRANLVTVKEFEPYLLYLLERVVGLAGRGKPWQQKPNEFTKNLCRYATDYYYDEVEKLFSRYHRPLNKPALVPPPN